ncbi:hypothetical protein BJV74DRAFT_859296 [Russula compacta]|nr:hypothetical protein BJV74DRAFT_859296 [Russula compacta]
MNSHNGRHVTKPTQRTHLSISQDFLEEKDTVIDEATPRRPSSKLVLPRYDILAPDTECHPTLQESIKLARVCSRGLLRKPVTQWGHTAISPTNADGRQP